MKNKSKLTPEIILAVGFAILISVGALLLYLPISHNEGVEVKGIDALFTATSSTCVTGLITVDPGDTFNIFGQAVMAVLIQFGGLGVAALGFMFMVITRKKIGIKDRVVFKEAMNLNSLKGVVKFFKEVIIITVAFEEIGAILSFIVFVQDYPIGKAIRISIFHSISAFNNAGIDIMGGGFRSLIDYKSNVLLMLVTCALIILGGIGYYVIQEIAHKRSFKHFSLHTKIVLCMTAVLLIGGTILLRLTEGIPWLGAFFYSTSARTAGFASYPLSGFSNAGLFVLSVLMFIGASPGGTGGGIKTTTTFSLIKSAFDSSRNKHFSSFKRNVPVNIISKAKNILVFALMVVLTDIFLISFMEPEIALVDIIVEVTSAFATVGLSTGITPSLGFASKLILILTMYIGRLGPLTIATMWTNSELPDAHYSEESIAVG